MKPKSLIQRRATPARQAGKQARASDHVTLSPDAVETLVNEREQFLRFLSRRLGNPVDADDLLQDSLLRALRRGDLLRRGERVVPWFYRILRNAVADHFRDHAVGQRLTDTIRREIDANDSGTFVPADFERAACRCFEGLLGNLRPRYAALVRRIDLHGETKAAVAVSLRIPTGSFDVTLHRARQALRRQLEVFCGACSREHCLACTCGPSREARRRREV